MTTNKTTNNEDRTIIVVDLFCGSGGSSTGMAEAIEEAGYKADITAINHWETAINTHKLNHPEMTHYCESIDGADPYKLIPGGHVDILWASPACTGHSNARGGKPTTEQDRATAWHVLRWAEALDVDNIFVENVREFRDWGPLHTRCTCGTETAKHTKPCKFGTPVAEKKGVYYRNFLRNLRVLGYQVDERLLCAADYGDATTRVRLFIQARKGKRPVWPEPTHLSSDRLGLYPNAQEWRKAREIIDWDLPGKSIYERDRPLAPNTMMRIMAGLRKFSGLPFIVPQFASQGPRSVERPIGTVTTTSRGVGLAEPYLVNMKGQSTACDIDLPMPTQTAGAAHLYLAEPFIVVLRNNCDGKSIDDPLPTVVAGGQHLSLCEPFIIVNRTHSDAHSIDDPIRTLTTGGNMALAEPYVIPVTHSGGSERAHDINEPLPTITTAHRGEFALVEPYLVKYHGSHKGKRDGDRRTLSIDEPVPTLDASNRIAVAEPYLVSYYGAGSALSLDDPLDTITTRDRFALVSPELVHLVDKGDVIGWLDIRFRMLQTHELAAATGFPKHYKFTGNRDEQVRQIGNAVCVKQAKALAKGVI